jgi:molybdopterin-dependent oxidoreductase alpha subunit
VTERRVDDSEEAFRRGAPKDVAAGIPGITHAVGHLLSEMGPVRAGRVMARLNRHEGVDCPGCAWPDPDHRSALGEFCENGAKAVAEEATTHLADADFFAAHPIADLAARSDHWLGKQGRIERPLVLEAGDTHYRPIGWEEAFRIVAEELTALPEPDRAIFYTSGRTSNEAAFLYQLLVRRFGTNNLPDCSNMCHESSGVALGETVGVGKGSVTLTDFDHADVIVVIGQNPGTNHPRMLTTLQRAKERGARIIAINPLREAALVRFRNPQRLRDLLGASTEIADLFLQVRINGDVPLLKSILRRLLAREDASPGTVFDHAFIDAHTEGFDEFVADLRRHDADALAAEAGVDPSLVESATDLLAAHDRIIVCWAMGLTQHTNAVDNIREIVNLLLVRGAIGKPGAGTCPVRGHSNVQGDRTMGVWEQPPGWFLDRLGDRFGFDPPRHHGLDTVGAIRAMHASPGHVFVAMGGNFLAAAPDTELTAEALAACSLTVHISTKLNRSHATPGRRSLILPCLGRTDRHETPTGRQFVTVENSMGVVHRSQGTLAPNSPHWRSEPAIVAGIAVAVLGVDDEVPWVAFAEDLDLVRDAIASVVPGFEDFNERVRDPDGFELPNPARERTFREGFGTALFTTTPLPADVLAPGALRMMTIRSHDQFNTTVYGMDDRYRGVRGGRRVVFMHPSDVADRGLVDGDLVDLRSDYPDRARTVEGFRVVVYDIPPGCCATYFPEGNTLVPHHLTAGGSNTPVSKNVHVFVERPAGP